MMYAADPLYQKASRLARGRSVVSEDNRINLYLICRFFLERLEPAHIVEFGAYKGGNALFMASVASELSPGTSVYALDTYTGIPDADPSIDAHSAGDFGDVDLGELRGYADKSGIGNVEFVQGRFEDTAAVASVTNRQSRPGAYRQRHVRVCRFRIRRRAPSHGRRRLPGLRRRHRVELSGRD